MQFVKRPLSVKQTQLGMTLLELLTVVSIIGIIAYASVPSFSEMMEVRDLSTAKKTLINSLYKAKSIAKSESTNVTVAIHNNQISLTQGNSSTNQKMNMPERIAVTADIAVTFNSMGLASNDVSSITIQHITNTSRNQEIIISTTGLIYEKI